MNGALIVNKPKETTSFGVIQSLKNTLISHAGYTRKTLPKLGHGGTLDPFATGVLVLLVGKGAKLARYFLHSSKKYEGVMEFGKTTASGDLTNPITETTDSLPGSLEEIQKEAIDLTLTPYLQTPPMFSAKKVKGKPLYELARKGLEIERKPKECILFDFEVNTFDSPEARFFVHCSSGTYIRTLAQDIAKRLGSLAYLKSLSRTASGPFDLNQAMSLNEIQTSLESKKSLDQLSCWVDFDYLLSHYPKIEATEQESLMISQGKQNVLFQILNRAQSIPKSDHLAIYTENRLKAVIRCTHPGWEIERVFK